MCIRDSLLGDLIEGDHGHLDPVVEPDAVAQELLHGQDLRGPAGVPGLAVLLLRAEARGVGQVGLSLPELSLIHI